VEIVEVCDENEHQQPHRRAGASEQLPSADARAANHPEGKNGQNFVSKSVE
jgi:hypothetical protein